MPFYTSHHRVTNVQKCLEGISLAVMAHLSGLKVIKNFFLKPLETSNVCLPMSIFPASLLLFHTSPLKVEKTILILIYALSPEICFAVKTPHILTHMQTVT